VHNACLSGGTLEIFMEPVLPPPVVAVVGDSPIAQALAVVGDALGYQVTQWSLREMRTTDALVVASHGFDEEQAIVDALSAGIPYVGLVASPKRGRALLDSLDIDDESKDRVHTPAGLDIGARTPEEVALSILAQVIEARGAASRVRALPLLEAETPATAIDPICKMTVAAVESSLHADVDGTRWYFCSPGCRETFLADPAAHMGA
jgi:xanthine dehydrogenase accessory factor